MARVFKKTWAMTGFAFAKVGVLTVVMLSLCCCGRSEHGSEWDIAVTAGDRIELFGSNGTLIGATVRQFTKLKALAYDGVRHTFIVSDTDDSNDTIYSVALTKDTTIGSIVQELPDDVQGLAIDPIEDLLFWTDRMFDKGINFVRLNDDIYEPQRFLNLSDRKPQDIVIDVCRRYIYWTNSDITNPTIERAFVNGTDHRVLIDSGITQPVGITIDYKVQRLYWADMREGVYYRIDRSDFDGKEREVVWEGTHVKPFGIAVDDEAIYWTDIHNDALWRLAKYDKSATPKKISSFKDGMKPSGLIAKNAEMRSYPDCRNLEAAIEKYREPEDYYESAALMADEAVEDGTAKCQNGGQLIEKQCKCSRGFAGPLCELQVCHNFCLHGECYLSSLGFPQCRCPRGYGGPRCENYMCQEYCLNGGQCSYRTGDVLPKCSCPAEFGGSRCEVGASFEDVCELYCKDREDEDILVSKENDRMCRCTGGTFVMVRSNATFTLAFSQAVPSTAAADQADFLRQNAVALALGAVSLVTIVGLTWYVCVHRRQRRPRVRKRYIINKNVTPLNNRPSQATEQCEITIENCCNMNVCETGECQEKVCRRRRTRVIHTDYKSIV